MGEKNSSKVLSEKELEEVLGGAKASGNNNGHIDNLVTRKCPACHVTGPHTKHMGGRVVCCNCGRPYLVS